MNSNTFFICLIILLYTCQGVEQGDDPEAEEGQVVKASESESFFSIDTATARLRSLPYTLHATARAQMSREAELSFSQAGLLIELRINEGKRIQKGQLIARLDTAELHLAHIRALDALLKAEIDRKDRLIQYRHTGDSITPEQQMNADIASGYRQAKTDLQAERLRLQVAQLRAPFSGIISDVKAKVFQQIGGGEVVATLVDVQTPLLRVGVLEQELSHIYVGQMAEITLPALLGQQFSGKVTSINPRVDEDGLIQVNVRILKPNGRIFPGMHAELQLKDSRTKAVILVPIEAVLQRSGKEVIFTYENGLAKWKYVTTGRKNGEYMEILEGLEVGEKVIVKGHVNLGHDARVEVGE